LFSCIVFILEAESDTDPGAGERVLCRTLWKTVFSRPHCVHELRSDSCSCACSRECCDNLAGTHWADKYHQSSGNTSQQVGVLAVYIFVPEPSN